MIIVKINQVRDNRRGTMSNLDNRDDFREVEIPVAGDVTEEIAENVNTEDVAEKETKDTDQNPVQVRCLNCPTIFPSAMTVCIRPWIQ